MQRRKFFGLSLGAPLAGVAAPAAADPMHKSTCCTCNAWGRGSKDDTVGQCRRHPPAYRSGPVSIWPKTRGIDWCGEHVRKR